MPKVSLNLAEHYVENWGAWEVGREIICNAIDADADYKLRVISDDEFIVTTETEPSVAALCVIGASTKRGTQDIGQFGEGFKLAALVATRMGGFVEVQTPSGKLTFSLEEARGIDDRVLYVNVDGRTRRSCGCMTHVKLQGVAAAINGKFVSRERTMIEKAKGPLSVYIKGVFIKTFTAVSLWDWNVDITLNRDRAIVDMWDVSNKIKDYLSGDEDVTQEVLEKVFRNTDSVEMTALDRMYVGCSYRNAKIAKEAWKEVFGEKAVIAAVSSSINQAATIKGFDVIPIARNLAAFGIKTANDVVSVTDELEEVFAPPHILSEIEVALDLMEIPAQVGFFKHYDSAPQGRADVKEGLIWLNEKLLMPGSKVSRLGTLAHEAAHIFSKAGDANISFEYKLDEICGKLLDKLMRR